MSEFIHIREVSIEPKSMTATIEIADNMPLNTAQDIQATARVYNLMPEIAEHACMGDGSETFRDVMGNTSIAHLFEHVAVELLSRTEPDEDITCGRTWVDEEDDHEFHVQILCSNDLLGCGALSSAAWIMHWAFADPEAPMPNIDAIVQGLAALPEVYKERQQEKENQQEDTHKEGEEFEKITEEVIKEGNEMEKNNDKKETKKEEITEPEILSQLSDQALNFGSSIFDDDKTPEPETVTEPEMLSQLSEQALNFGSSLFDDDKTPKKDAVSEPEMLSHLTEKLENVVSATDLKDDKTPQKDPVTEPEMLSHLSDNLLNVESGEKTEEEAKAKDKSDMPSSIHIDDDYEV